MKRLFIIAMITAAGIAFAQNADVTVTVTGVAAGKAPIYVALYDSDQALKKNKPVATLVLSADAESVTGTVSLSAGEYYVTAYQDANDNGKLDTNFIGMPKEPVGIANYDGKSIPGGFSKHKLFLGPSNPSVAVALKQIG